MESTKSSTKTTKEGKPENIQSASFRMAVETQINKFKFSDAETLEFPSTLLCPQREFIKEMAYSNGLKHKTSGSGLNLHVVVYKTIENLSLSSSVKLDLRLSSKKVVSKVLEILSEDAYTDPSNSYSPSSPIESPTRSSTHVISVPVKSFNFRCAKVRQELPVYQHRERILNLIRDNQIVVIESSTGSGKSTQIPQYILEDAAENNKPCRILVAEPKRICATSLAERVSFERGETVGGSVGYQIRLEAKVAPTSNLIYVTNGVIIRMLMGGKPEQFFNSITTLIIDEVHERDRMSDFLMLCVREFVHLNKNLKVIIMSATFQADFFSSYFGNCPVFKLDGQMFDVKELFLEDILKLLNFSNSLVIDLYNTYGEHPELLESKPLSTDVQNLDDDTKDAVNELLEKMSLTNDCNNEYFNFFYMVKAEKVPVDIRCTKTNQTCLMIATSYGLHQEIVTLLGLRADPSLKAEIGDKEMNSFEIAMERGDNEIALLLKNHMELVNEVSANPPEDNIETTPFDRMLLDIYYDTLTLPGINRGVFLEDYVDLNLIVYLVHHLHFKTDPTNAILIFLPGHEEIVQLANLLFKHLDTSYNIFILHSQMNPDDQVNVFDRMPQGVRKIIIATNIAESSITVNDVVYVIDCGKAKQKTFNPVNQVSTLQAEWISKASATQRKGRSGRLRDGVVFRLYSRDRYNYLIDNPKPEFLRCEMTDICLQAKMISQDNIIDFLKRAITPPNDTTVNYSIKILNDIGALNFDQSLTQLGFYLADIPLNAKYAKMLVYAIFFKCIDPILTLVSILSVNDPFILSSAPEEREKSYKLKKRLEDGSFSDHFVMLKIFQKWNEYKTSKEFDGGFCEDNFVNSGTMERVASTRLKIVSYLRSVRLISSVGNMSGLNDHSSSWSVIKLCIAAGSYPGIARVLKNQGKIVTSVDLKALVHQNSVIRFGANIKAAKEALAEYPSDWIVYEEKNSGGQISVLKMCTVVSSICVALAAGHGITISDERWSDDDGKGKLEPDEDTIMELEVDKFIKFSSKTVVAYQVAELRERLNDLFRRFLRNVDKFRFNENDEILVEAIVKVLELEDEKAGFKIKYEGIGSRPRVITRESDTRRSQFMREDIDAMANDHVDERAGGDMNQMPLVFPDEELATKMINLVIDTSNSNNMRYFITEMKSEDVCRKMKSNVISLAEAEAQLPAQLLDTLFELEINDRVTKKVVIFYRQSEIVGAGMLFPFYDTQMTREKMKISFQCAQKFSMSMLKTVTTAGKFRALLLGSFAEVPKEVGKVCVDLCLNKH